MAGFANLPDNNSRHAMLWLYGFRFDLGTLGGPNSNVPWPVKNTNGLIAGIAQTTTPQPRGETWSCRSFFATPTRAAATCLGVVWEEGKIRALPTLGGDNGFATGANNHRQVVGWAENKVEDSSCVRAADLPVPRDALGTGPRPRCASCRRWPATARAQRPASTTRAR